MSATPKRRNGKAAKRENGKRPRADRAERLTADASWRRVNHSSVVGSITQGTEQAQRFLLLCIVVVVLLYYACVYCVAHLLFMCLRVLDYFRCRLISSATFAIVILQTTTLEPDLFSTQLLRCSAHFRMQRRMTRSVLIYETPDAKLRNLNPGMAAVKTGAVQTQAVPKPSSRLDVCVHLPLRWI